VFDASGSGYTGTYAGSKTGNQTGTYYSTGAQVGPYACTFDGSTNWINMGSIAPADAGTTGSVTVVVWFKTSATSDQSLIDCKDIGSNDGGYTLEVRSSGIEVRIGNGSTQTAVIGSGTYDNGQWHMAVGVIDRAAGLLRIYADGAQINTMAFTTSWNLSCTQPFILGGYAGTTANFTGLINDVRIYNRALSAGQIAAIYTAE
jgi:sialidase-1